MNFLEKIGFKNPFRTPKSYPTPEAPSNAIFLLDHPDPTGALLRDLREGLRYTHNGIEHIFPWNTTFLELKDLPFSPHVSMDQFGWEICHIDQPLRLGSLEITGLKINIPDPARMPGARLDVPVDSLPFEVRLDGNGVDNFWKLKAYLGTALGEPIHFEERKDKLHATWNADGLLLSITYWFYSYTSNYESGYALLHINNQRVFPAPVSNRP